MKNIFRINNILNKKILFLLFLIGFTTCAKPALGKIECQRITKIILISKGFNQIDFKELVISDKKRIEEMCSIMNSSKSYKNPSTKNNRGYISINIYYNDSKYRYDLVETLNDGYILDGVAEIIGMRNDSLASYIRALRTN